MMVRAIFTSDSTWGSLHSTPKISMFVPVSRLMLLENSVILRGLLPDNGLWFAQSAAAQSISITRLATLSLVEITSYSVSSVGDLL